MLAVSKIREAMTKAHGHVYDANELMLPLPTKRPPLRGYDERGNEVKS